MHKREWIAKNGEEFKLNIGGEKTFRMDEFMGEGGSCLTYKVTVVDGADAGVTLILKEFYPEADSYIAKRGENRELIFAERTLKDEGFQRLQRHFREGYERLLEFTSDGDTVNYNVKPAGIATYSDGRGYSLVHWDNGMTLDRCSRLLDILESLIKTAEIMERIHEKEYFHLDLKPSNILWLPDVKNVLMFDLDTVSDKNDIKDLTCPVRKSENNAYNAPELINAVEENSLDKRNRIGVWTDIYSIGAILLEKLTGIWKRDIIQKEESNKFELKMLEDLEIFSRTDPRIYSKLREFFKKTLSYEKKYRYKSMQEVRIALERIKEIAEYQIYLKGDSPESYDPGIFIGREEEIIWLEDVLATERSAVLSGMGGIGKSVLARAYAKKNADTYGKVIICDYKAAGSTGLKQLVWLIEETNVIRNNVKMIEETGEGRACVFEVKYQTLKRLCKVEQVLLIIDNFDVEEDSYAKQFLAIGWQVIFTSRCLLNSSFGKRKEIGELEELEELFEAYYREENESKKFTETEKEEIRELLGAIGRHTITTELLAKELSMLEGTITIGQMTEKIQEGLEQSRRKVTYIKDNESKMLSVYAALHSVFNITEAQEYGLIDDVEREILRQMALLVMPVTEKEFMEMAGLDKKGDYAGSFVMLKRKGWLQENIRWRGITEEKIFSLHPVVLDVLCHEFFFCMDNCGTLVETMLCDCEKMKRSFVFTNVKGKLMFVDNALKLALREEEGIKRFECGEDVLIRLYDVCGVLSGENGEREKASRAFETEEILLKKRKKFFPLKRKELKLKENELKVDKMFWGTDEIDLNELENNKNINRYHVAQFKVGENYLQGHGEPTKKRIWAAIWFREAAKQGNARAQIKVGNMHYCDNATLGIDPVKANEWFEKAAKQGDVYAQFILGNAYCCARGVEKDYGKANEWFRKAAEQGDDRAQLSLGVTYYFGRGVEIDHGIANEWLRISAQNGNAIAKFSLERIKELEEFQICLKGDFSANYKPKIFIGRKEELTWLEDVLETERSVVLSGAGGIGKSLLARAYATRNINKYDKVVICDYGVTVGLKQLVWFIDDEYVVGNRKGKPENKDEIRINRISEELYREDELALGLEVKKKSLKQLCEREKVLLIIDNFCIKEDSYLQTFLSIGWKVIFTSRCVLNDSFGQAREVGELKSEEIEELFEIHYSGTSASKIITESEKEEITKLLSIVGGHTLTVELLGREMSRSKDMQFALGNVYRYPRGEEEIDYEKANEWFRRSAKTDAKRALGDSYYFGLGVTVDYEKAKEWYQKAAEQGDADAQYNLGLLYELGQGVEKNIDTAIYWYRKAARQKLTRAIERLKELRVD